MIYRISLISDVMKSREQINHEQKRTHYFFFYTIRVHRIEQKQMTTTNESNNHNYV